MPAPTASLGPLQRRILELLADLEPPFVLAGGGAIAGFYSLQTAPQFHRFSVEAGDERCVLDLVAEPAALGEPPKEVALGRVRILVESPLALLAEKLCALLGRAEPRDLDDVGHLLDAGTDLRAALALAPSIDGGFSALTLAWNLDRLDLQRIAEATGYEAPKCRELDAVRKDLIDRLTSEPPSGQDRR